MPFNRTKTLRISDFMEAVQRRLRGNYTEALSFFEVYLMGTLVADLVKEADMNPHCMGHPLLAGDYDVIYPFAAKKLRDCAGRNFCEAHPDSYEIANTVCEAIRDELNEFFECSDQERL